MIITLSNLLYAWKFDYTSLSFCQIIQLCVCLSFLLHLLWQFHQTPLSVFSDCLPLLGCVDSSSVSCHCRVLLRHGHWSNAWTLLADGQVTVLSHTFILQKFLSPSKVFVNWLPRSPFSTADHLAAGELTERGTGRRLTEILSCALLRKSAGRSQRSIPLLFISPMLCLHLESMHTCEQKNPQN